MDLNRAKKFIKNGTKEEEEEKKKISLDERIEVDFCNSQLRLYIHHHTFFITYQALSS